MSFNVCASDRAAAFVPFGFVGLEEVASLEVPGDEGEESDCEELAFAYAGASAKEASGFDDAELSRRLTSLSLDEMERVHGGLLLRSQSACAPAPGENKRKRDPDCASVTPALSVSIRFDDNPFFQHSGPDSAPDLKKRRK